MVRFADILSPVPPARFFAEHHGRAPLHVPGGAEKFAAMKKFQDDFRYRGAAAGPRYRPTATDFAVTAQSGGWVLARGGKGAPIPPGFDRAVAWIVARPDFSDAEFAAAFPALVPEARGELLRSLLAMKVIAAL